MATGKDMAAEVIGIFKGFKAHVAAQMAALEQKLATLIDTRVAAIPAGQKGADAVIDYERLAGAAVALLQPYIQRMEAEARAALAKAIADIPTPKDGADGKSVEPSEVAQMVSAEVAKIAPPTPGKDGRDGTDGRSVEPAEVQAMVDAAVKALPLPARGERGEKGETGAPATLDIGFVEQAVSLAVEQTVAQAVESAVKALPPPVNGRDGLDGPTLEQTQQIVSKAVQQAVGAIPVPQDGKPGDPGRDAAQIEILPYIEPDRCYGRGTFASHAGGIVRAARTTDYLDTLKPGETIESKGWHVVINGPADTTIEQIDERTLVVRSQMTNGRVIERKVSMPVMIYRGVWREGPHVPGDTTTWAGSLWHCNEPTTEKPGDGCKSWTLVAKRGANGKDAR